jgi:hypothetical protein
VIPTYYVLSNASTTARSHASQVVYLYEHLFDDIDQPSLEDQRWRQTALENARKLLERAEENRNAMNERIIAEYGSEEAVRYAFLDQFAEQAGRKFEQEEAFLNKSDDDEEDDSGLDIEDENEVQVGQSGGHDQALDEADEEQDTRSAESGDNQNTANVKSGGAVPTSTTAHSSRPERDREQEKIELARLDAQRLNASLADNSYQDTEYPMPDPDETRPGDPPLPKMTFAELMDLDD